MIVINRILVPVDFSDHSRHALEFGCVFASRFGSQLHLLHVVPGATMLTPDIGGLGTIDLLEQTEAMERAAMERLSALPPNDWHNDRETIRSVSMGSAFDGISEYAREAKIDLIVMGTHGRSGLTHLLLGSVAENMVRASVCPVLTIKPKENVF